MFYINWAIAFIYILKEPEWNVMSGNTHRYAISSGFVGHHHISIL